MRGSLMRQGPKGSRQTYQIHITQMLNKFQFS